MEYDPGTVEALRVVEDVAREAVEAGRAKITMEYSDEYPGWFIELTPTNLRACAVWLAASNPPLINMSLGLEPTTVTYEIWQDDDLVQLRLVLEAVVAGHYEQSIETRKRNRITVIGRFDTPDGEYSHTNWTTASAAVKPGEKHTLRFEPY